MDEVIRNELLKYVGENLLGDDPQAEFKPGDPQIAALCQYLATKLEMDRSRVIIDFGSGKGLLAKAIDHVWSERPCPYYVAVDFDSPLAELSLPRKVHNVSRKVEVEEFFGGELAGLAERVAVVVLRNVLHEMDIQATARLLHALRASLPADAEIYVQDMVSLPRVERGRVGWEGAILRRLLNHGGFASDTFSQTSWSGTEWFALAARVSNTGPHPSPADLAEACAAARQEQKRLLIQQLQDLETPTPKRYFELNHDIASIEVQLQSWERESGRGLANTPDAPHFRAAPVFAASTFGPDEFAVELPAPVASTTGLSAVLANKRIIDLAALFLGCADQILLAGYSQRSLFREPVLNALKTVIARGRSVRVLLVDPDSHVARLRAREPAYGGLDELPRDIHATVESARVFREHLLQERVDAPPERFDVRLSQGLPYASFFIVDDLCFFSLYSRSLGGSRAPCFVARHTAHGANRYYEILEGDFRAWWDEAPSIFAGNEDAS